MRSIEGKAIPSRMARVCVGGIILMGGVGLYGTTAIHMGGGVDEGYFLGSASRVELGERPYLDFSFSQMPGMAYGIALWSKVIPERSLAWARAPFAAGMVLLLLLLGGLALRRTGSPGVALAAAFLTGASELFMLFGSLVITYVPVTMTSLLAYAFAIRAEGSCKRRVMLGTLCGVCCGAALSIRILVAPMVPLFAIWLLLRARRAALIGFIIGFVSSMSPTLCLAMSDPFLFYYNNIFSHGPIRNVTLFGRIPQKFVMFSNLFSSVQTFCLIALAAAGASIVYRQVGWNRFLKSPEGLAALLVVVLGGAHFLPSPVHLQYFTLIVPFLCVCGLPALSRYFDGKRLSILLTGYLCVVPVYFYHCFRTVDPGFEMRTIQEVIREVSRVSTPDDLVLDLWGVCQWAVQRQSLPQVAGYVSIRLGRTLSTQEARRLKTWDHEDLLQLLKTGRVRVVVAMGLSYVFGKRSEFFREVLEERYEHVFEAPGVIIYRARG